MVYDRRYHKLGPILAPDGPARDSQSVGLEHSSRVNGDMRMHHPRYLAQPEQLEPTCKSFVG